MKAAMTAPRVEIDKSDDAVNSHLLASCEAGLGMACLESIIKMFPEKIRPKILRSATHHNQLVIMWTLSIDVTLDECELLRIQAIPVLASMIRFRLLGGIDDMIEQLYNLVENLYPEKNGDAQTQAGTP